MVVGCSVIKELFIKNFQKHDKLKVSFGDITTIVGASDKGKSAVIRALRWVCRNQPRGEAFKKDGEDVVAVKMVLDDGNFIVRSRGKSGNVYTLSGDDFNSFGSGVPDTIQDVIKTDDVNFQGQHDPPFWLGLSSAEVSRQINQISDLEVIDRSIAKAKKKHGDEKDNVRTARALIESTEKQIAELVWVDEAVVEFEPIQLGYKELQVLSEDVDRLATYSDVIARLNKSLTKTSACYKELVYIVHEVDEFVDLKRACDGLISFVNDLEWCENVIFRGAPDVSDLNKLHDEYVAVVQDGVGISLLITRLRKLSEDSVLDRYHEVTGILEQYDSVCPECGRPL
jgi:energy-coupling factor transporter ATP-binding protein EcfA2